MPASGSDVTDALNLPEVPVQGRPATDSSRILLGLIDLSRAAENDTAGLEALDCVIAPSILRKLLGTLHFRDAATVLHSRRVAQLSVGVAQHLRWEGRHLKLLEIASLLHDIGKIGVPDSILFKPGKLNPDEAELMALHLHVGVDVLQACRVDHNVSLIVSQSRDFNYETASRRPRPAGTAHLGARILSVADAYDSLRTEQVYRRAKSHDEALKILLENAGARFDANIVTALAHWSNACGLAQAADYQTETFPASIGPTFNDRRDAFEADNLCQIFSHLYLMENLYDAFYLVDSDLKFAVWNGGMQRLLGRGSEEVLQRPWSSRMLNYADASGRELEDTEVPMRSVVESGRPIATTAKLRNADGRLIDVELHSVPLMDDWGRLRGVAEIIRDASRTRVPAREYRDLRLAASRDPLTGAANRGELESQLAQMLRHLEQDPGTGALCAIFIDVDHFKAINDAFGHTTGDIVLIEIARLLQQETFAGELVGRYGGEEFMILCPDTHLDQAIKRAERMRLAIAGLELAEMEGWTLSASFGVTQTVAGDTVRSAMKRADKALYAAKNGGRNQTCFLLADDDCAIEPGEPDEVPPADGRLKFDASFHACTAAEMIVYKLGGFVTEIDAKLLEIKPDRVRLRLGRPGMFSGWGKSEERKPVDIELDFSSEVPPREVNGRLVKSNQVLVRVSMRPVGQPRTPEEFDCRCRLVLKQLSTYFLAEI